MKIHLNVILGDNKHEMIQNVLVFLACDRGDGIVKKEEDLNEFIAMLLSHQIRTKNIVDKRAKIVNFM